MATGLGAFSHVTLGVADLDAAIDFWTGTFGLRVRDRREGKDPVFAEIHGLGAEAVDGQAILETPGARAGRIHLVRFAHPGSPVREGAGPCDLLPKNLDIYTRDLPERYETLRDTGTKFRAPWVEMPGPDGLRFREAHLPGHDEINVVLLEAIGPGYETPMTPQGFAAMGPVVTIVPDGGREAAFYSQVLGMDETLHLLLQGAEIEKMIGLPPGAGLDLRIFGAADDPMGRVELIEYQQAGGENRYPRARPPATGILHIGYRVADLAPLREQLERNAIAIESHGAPGLLTGSGTLIAFRSPAGLRIEVQQTD